MRVFAGGWGKGKPPDLGNAVHVDAELIAPNSLPYGGGVFQGRERIAQWFADVEADNVWIYEFADGELRRARVYADTATIRDAVAGHGSSR